MTQRQTITHNYSESVHYFMMPYVSLQQRPGPDSPSGPESLALTRSRDDELKTMTTLKQAPLEIHIR